ncbi:MULTISPECIES: glycoside hydrolase family 88/105 protein [Prevotella]|uniref:glycoside hydrolase family 88/105 protein n=2 Tax=Prevotellaceae TaxID=171552 RepID=UPI0027E2E363|nr:glycoside hydrolase family 88 protein [uncultured Prevotella sp.]
MNVITNKLNTSLPSLLGKARVWGFFLFLLFSLPLSAKTWTADQVKELITRVNTYWQQNNKAETRSFWDPAAYHTGNMEVYKLLKDDKQLDYTRRWAYHNNWSGATEADPSRWKYANYGEGKDYVLFGDWQVCFQTYIDLYNLAIANGGTDADNYFMVKRAKEVMHYEAYSKKDDYWWWSDALYMVMPVMTKMYKLTGDVQYLDKLYENLLYSDRIMLDQETGLYFRDARYVYPNHKSVNGKKDFWARGDGWVLAGLAKVLQDLPKDYKHYKFFVDKFQRLADIVAKTQQKEGYWTRSILDPNHAPGPETSGTAFFAYGIMWGVNNGFLAKKDYKKCIDRAWQYISETAVQADGKVGYVQPIGDRAIPGQTVDANSQANFGVGAVLLAACEYYRYIDNQK